MNAKLEEVCRQIGETAGLDTVRAYLSAGEDVNATHGPAHRTLLDLACEHRNTELVLELLNAGAVPDTRDASGRTPLHRVVEADVRSAFPRAQNPAADEFSITRALLVAGANPLAADCDGKTPRDKLVEHAEGSVGGATLLAHYDAIVASRMNGIDAAVLGYAPCWLDSGILSPETLLRQLCHFRGPRSDSSTEHYRNGALRNYMGSHPSFTDAELAALLEVAHVELLSGPLHGHVFHELVRHRGLSDTQFDHVATQWTDPGFQCIVTRNRLLRELRAHHTDPLVLDRCQVEGDSYVHQALLALPDLATERVVWLAANGAIKRVRSIAAERGRRGQRRTKR